MWEKFSQRLSITIIHAFTTETGCMNNSKIRVKLQQNILPLQKKNALNVKKSEKAHFCDFKFRDCSLQVLRGANNKLRMQDLDLMSHDRSISLSQSKEIRTNDVELLELKTLSDSAGQQ
jgi:hypothetical protein